MKHTKGKWFVIHTESKFPIYEVMSGEIPEAGHIAKLYTATMQNKEEQEANARLIAAAPELLEALNIMTSLCRIKYGNIDKDVYNEILKAESLIEKATQP